MISKLKKIVDPALKKTEPLLKDDSKIEEKSALGVQNAANGAKTLDNTSATQLQQKVFNAQNTANTAQMQAPQMQAPQMQAPQVQAPQMQPQMQPQVQVPQVQAPQVQPQLQGQLAKYYIPGIGYRVGNKTDKEFHKYLQDNNINPQQILPEDLTKRMGTEPSPNDKITQSEQAKQFESINKTIRANPDTSSAVKQAFLDVFNATPIKPFSFTEKLGMADAAGGSPALGAYEFGDGIKLSKSAMKDLTKAAKIAYKNGDVASLIRMGVDPYKMPNSLNIQESTIVHEIAHKIDFAYFSNLLVDNFIQSNGNPNIKRYDGYDIISKYFQSGPTRDTAQNIEGNIRALGGFTLREYFDRIGLYTPAELANLDSFLQNEAGNARHDIRMKAHNFVGSNMLGYSSAPSTIVKNIGEELFQQIMGKVGNSDVNTTINEIRSVFGGYSVSSLNTWLNSVANYQVGTRYATNLDKFYAYAELTAELFQRVLTIPRSAFTTKNGLEMYDIINQSLENNKGEFVRR